MIISLFMDQAPDGGARAARRGRPPRGLRGPSSGGPAREQRDHGERQISCRQLVNLLIRTFRMSPNAANVAMIDDPPALIRGSVSPFTGASPADIVML
jgi:hypothetical protein